MQAESGPRKFPNRNDDFIRQTAPAPQSGQDGDHWVTIDHRHILIHDHAASGRAARARKTRKINKLYREFSGLRPVAGYTTSDDLRKAIRNAAHVYENTSGHGFQAPATLPGDDARDVRIPGTPAAQTYRATEDAVDTAELEPDVTRNANHVYLYDPALREHPDWVKQGETTTIAGPFINQAGGGDIPKGDRVYIITVNDRNMRGRRQ